MKLRLFLSFLVAVACSAAPLLWNQAKRAGGGGVGGPVVASMKYNAAGGSVTSSSMDTTGATLLIFATASYLSDNAPTDPLGNTYTQLSVSGEGFMRLRVYYCANPTVSSSHTWTHASTYGAVNIVAAFYGTISSPLDQQAFANSSSVSTLAAGSITPSQAASLLVAVGCCYNPGGTATISDGLTVVQSFAGAGGYELSLAYKVLSAATAINPTWSPGASQAEFSAKVANFKN